MSLLILKYNICYEHSFFVFYRSFLHPVTYFYGHCHGLSVCLLLNFTQVYNNYLIITDPPHIGYTI